MSFYKNMNKMFKSLPPGTVLFIPVIFVIIFWMSVLVTRLNEHDSPVKKGLTAFQWEEPIKPEGPYAKIKDFDKETMYKMVKKNFERNSYGVYLIFTDPDGYVRTSKYHSIEPGYQLQKCRDTLPWVPITYEIDSTKSGEKMKVTKKTLLFGEKFDEIKSYHRVTNKKVAKRKISKPDGYYGKVISVERCDNTPDAVKEVVTGFRSRSKLKCIIELEIDGKKVEVNYMFYPAEDAMKHYNTWPYISLRKKVSGNEYEIILDNDVIKKGKKDEC